MPACIQPHCQKWWTYKPKYLTEYIQLIYALSWWQLKIIIRKNMARELKIQVSWLDYD